MSQESPMERRTFENCWNYHPILDSCRKGENVRGMKARKEGCGEWEKDE